MTPGAGAAVPALLERNRLQRLERLLRAAASGAGRRRAGRRRMRALVSAPGARMRWHSVPAPEAPGPEQAIVHPLGSGHFGGAFSDELVVPYADGMLVPLPDGVAPAAAASLSDNIADAYRHIAPHLPALLEADGDARILIIAGLSRRPLLSASVALYAGQIALALGARNVRLVDSRAEVRAHAERLGLIALKSRELRGHAPAPLVVHSSADPLRIALAHTLAGVTKTVLGRGG
jgi:hypothetical protein